MSVSHETIRRWCDKFGATFARRVKAVRRKPGRTWHLDEMFVYLRGESWLLWRAVDEHGTELDILLHKQRDKAAAKRIFFFQRVLRSFTAPRKIVIDPLRSYPAAKAGIPAPANVKHVFVTAAARGNNRAENSHQPPRERERRMRGFRDPTRTQAFFESFGLIRQHFALKRHLLRASLYRKHLAVRFSTWRELTGAIARLLTRVQAFMKTCFTLASCGSSTLAAGSLRSRSVTVFRGNGYECNIFPKKRLAAALSRCFCSSTSSSTPCSSIARNSTYSLPRSLKNSSSRCHLVPPRGRPAFTQQAYIAVNWSRPLRSTSS